ncbi:MAG: S46 family peptidase [Bacteroidetes bacterium]|nr:S46 family peptidase [Bacteroidota bacterium]
MDADAKIRIMYAAKYADCELLEVFYWTNQRLERMRVAEQRAADEAKFQAWADSDPARKAKYGAALTGLKKKVVRI